MPEQSTEEEESRRTKRESAASLYKARTAGKRGRRYEEAESQRGKDEVGRGGGKKRARENEIKRTNEGEREKQDERIRERERKRKKGREKTDAARWVRTYYYTSLQSYL